VTTTAGDLFPFPESEQETQSRLTLAFPGSNSLGRYLQTGDHDNTGSRATAPRHVTARTILRSMSWLQGALLPRPHGMRSCRDGNAVVRRKQTSQAPSMRRMFSGGGETIHQSEREETMPECGPVYHCLCCWRPLISCGCCTKLLHHDELLWHPVHGWVCVEHAPAVVFVTAETTELTFCTAEALACRN
jgi:hypothetical protein